MSATLTQLITYLDGKESKEIYYVLKRFGPLLHIEERKIIWYNYQKKKKPTTKNRIKLLELKFD